jgi:hypothetical protein
MPCAARLAPRFFRALSEFGAELVAPATDRFVRDHHTSLEQQILDVPQAQTEPEIPANRTTDDDGREAVAVIKRSCLLPRFILAPPLHQPDSAHGTLVSSYLPLPS